MLFVTTQMPAVMKGALDMQLGMIGLGRMGGSMVRRLLRGGHACVVFDSQSARVTSLAHDGAAGSHSLDEFIRALDPPRVWVAWFSDGQLRRRFQIWIKGPGLR